MDSADQGVPQQGGHRRRRFLASLGVLAIAGVAKPARATPSERGPRELRFEHTHTGEKLRVCYFDGRAYEPEALATIDRYLRDFRTGETCAIDVALLDQLFQVHRLTEAATAFQVISGYRSPKTNRQLRADGHGVASNSMHLLGRAIDIRLPGVELTQLREAARSMLAGGVGYYAASDFVHLDTGRVRYW